MRPPLHRAVQTGLLLTAIACAPSPEGMLAPEDALYDGVLIVAGQAEAAPTQFVTYAATGACETADQVHVVGLCDLVLTPDAAGFTELPAVDATERPFTCRHHNRTWGLAGGVVHVSFDGEEPRVRIDAAEACTLNTALGGPPDPVCETDVLYRLDLRPIPDSTSGLLPCTLPAGSTHADGRCGPTLGPLRCDADADEAG